MDIAVSVGGAQIRFRRFSSLLLKLECPCRRADSASNQFDRSSVSRSVISLSEFAAFLADELEPARRDELTRHFADHPEARELLQMSYEAWRAGGTVVRRKTGENGPIVRRG